MSRMGAVHALRTGTSAIRSAHNGSVQVAQVVVCHALCAAREIDWKAFPKSWQSTKHLCVCVFHLVENRRGEPEPFTRQMRLSLIMFIFT